MKLTLKEVIMNKNKTIKYNDEVYELIENGECPLCFIYRNINDFSDFLIRDYSITLDDEVEIYNKRTVKKVKCIETGKIFSSPAKAGRYYGFADGDMISKVCRGARETAKGLHFEYI